MNAINPIKHHLKDIEPADNGKRQRTVSPETSKRHLETDQDETGTAKRLRTDPLLQSLPDIILKAWNFQSEQNRQVIENIYNRHFSQIGNPKIARLMLDNRLECIGRIFGNSIEMLSDSTIDKLIDFKGFWWQTFGSFEKIQLADRIQIMELTSPYLTSVSDFHDYKYFIQTIEAIEKPDRSDVFEKSLPLSKMCTNLYTA